MTHLAMSGARSAVLNAAIAVVRAGQVYLGFEIESAGSPPFQMQKCFGGGW